MSSISSPSISSSYRDSVEPNSIPRSSWTDLPLEIRFMIMKEVVREKYHKWSFCATINREWQAFIEKENFKRLKLGVSCLEDLNDEIPQHKRHLVKHIWLEISIPRDPSACCASWSPPPARTSKIVHEAIQDLFDTLSVWEERKDDQLTLEINIVSPSDSRHWFGPLYFSDCRTGEDEGRVGTRHDPKHGWIDGEQVKAPPEVAVQRLFRPIKLDTSFINEPLPRVMGVTGFVIRRQLRRCISPAGLGAILEALPSLKHMSYEPWELHTATQLNKRQHHLKHLRTAMLQGLSSNVTSLVVFEDSRNFYKVLPRTDSNELATVSVNSIGIADGLGDMFARESYRMEHLAVSFIVDAKDVFRHCKASWTWKKLKSVALTSKLLRVDQDLEDKIGSLLCKAANMAKRMPEMDTFVIWNGGKDNACAFIYRRNRGEASITWRGTWRLEMSEDVIKAWESAALMRSDRMLKIRYEEISNTINCVGDALYHLELPCQVVEPASLWQMRKEGNLVL